MLFALIALNGSSLNAQEAHPQSPGVVHKEERESSKEYHQHHLSFFLGGSHHEGENGATYGGDYEFRFHRRFGLGVDFEYAAGDFRDDIFIFPLTVHATRSLKFTTGPGFERELRRVEVENGEPHVREASREFVYRFGILYDIFHKSFSVTPNVAFDFSPNRTVIVYGVSFGFGFKAKE